MSTTLDLPGIDPAKCRRRNNANARRYGQDATPVRLLAPADLALIHENWKIADAWGRLPTDPDEALQLINRHSQIPLSADSVYIHYGEAANDNFIGDRFMFLDETTLRNIAAGAASGVSFMNSHRVGQMSAPAELPYGRTFAGAYRTYELPDGSARRSALFGFYMLRGEYPNGPNGPSTDYLHRAISSGTLSDVSVGLYGGWRRCDVCEQDLSEGACDHIPGTRRKMNEAQVLAQSQRGVERGVASYSVMSAGLGEISGVYKGAIAGAGFRKALQLQKARALDEETLDDVLESYGQLALDTDFGEPGGLLDGLAERIVARLRPGDQEGELGIEPIRFAFDFAARDNSPDQGGDLMANEPVTRLSDPNDEQRLTTGPSPDVLALRAELDQLRAERDEYRAKLTETSGQVADLVRERHLAQFRRLADGSAGARWFGDIEAQAEALHALHVHPDFGPDHPVTNLFLQVNRAFAEHLASSPAFRGLGVGQRGERPASAAAELSRRTKELAKSEGLTEREAMAQVFADNDELYERYRRESFVRAEDLD